MDDKKQSAQKDAPSLGVSELITAENLETLISIISASVGITTATVKALSVWIEDRKSRKIKVRYKETEVEIAGGMPREKIEEVLEIFANFHKEKIDEEKIKILIDDDQSRKLLSNR